MDSDDLFVRVVTCTGLYKTSFIRENQIQYNETPGAAFQDQGFWFQTTALANRMMFVIIALIMRIHRSIHIK